MSRFIFIPKNSGLEKLRDFVLESLNVLGNPRTITLRGEDVPFWVNLLIEKGQNAFGLTGEDLFSEFMLSETSSSLKVLKRIEWNDPCAIYGKPALCLMGPAGGNIECLPNEMTIGIPSKYRLIADEYLKTLERKGFNFRKIYMTGCVETSCLLGVADIVIDIVYTGRSMKEQGLEVYEVIMKSDFLVIGGGRYD